MEILIGQTCVYLKDVNLGESFSDMTADLMVDRFGKVRVYRESTLSFFTDLNHLPSEILMAASDGLGLRARPSPLTRIRQRITALLEARALDASSE